jgi:23S rRNA (cytosine1962-C5)-methyltransferase
MSISSLILDIYGEYVVAQINSAGMDNLKKIWIEAVKKVFEKNQTNLKGIYIDASSKHRKYEGLDNNSCVAFGQIPEIIEVKENNLTYFADIINGQKTGWFYDQRSNRKFLSELAKSKSVLDLYTHSGGFGLLAAKNGAAQVELVDRSSLGLELAEKTAAQIQLIEALEQRSNTSFSLKPINKENRIKFIKSEVFEYLNNSNENKKFDIVNADPPAFIKNKKDIAVGLKGYEKLVKQCVKLVNKYGIFAISSCSYFARPDIFQKTIESALDKSGKTYELLRKSGADIDHPIHPLLPETNYLKFLVYRIY